MFRQRKTSIKQRNLEKLLKLGGKLGGWKYKSGHSKGLSGKSVRKLNFFQSLNIYQDNKEDSSSSSLSKINEKSSGWWEKYFHYAPLKVSRNYVISISDWADYDYRGDKDCVIF